jgi:hypothetical protein
VSPTTPEIEVFAAIGRPAVDEQTAAAGEMSSPVTARLG